MKKTLLPIAALGACAGLALRRLPLARSYDAANLIPRGDGISLSLYLLCALAAAAILILCLREPAGAHCRAEKNRVRGLLVVVSALALLASHMPPDLTGGFKSLVVPALAFASACAMAIEGLYHMNGDTGSLLGGCILPIYLGATLISEYRTWSHDPMVADFCFPLLFLVSAMLASYHLAAFRVGRGKRRTAAFLVGCAVLFAGPVLADGAWRQILRTLAVSLYLVAELWPYLSKPLPAPAEEAPEASAAEPEAAGQDQKAEDAVEAPSDGAEVPAQADADRAPTEEK